ncbi:primosomal protein N' [Gemella sp. oral taxon 928]|uniref:replication restart helicase PriA n=1 Tax=unclassified Gemella TaxID=2624949 RepID=UPI0007680FCD|nr:MULTISPECIES: primosomal protein N' [unclassified Gemella]AME09384.1 primosomal protein N' [Gemella sp. oral taxon 928]AXI27021.1 primosomal protein N' [Gemella sp. ND 6198]
MFAEVIVDVNAYNVDRTFYYLIPEELRGEDIIGYRVEVPFGTRIVQGYVINIFERYNGEISEFKYIKRLKDNFPILTKEMLLLSKVMANELFCTRIQVIETIVPTILKNKYIEYYELLDANKTLLIDYGKHFKDNLIEKKKFEKLFSKQEIGYLLSVKAIKLISKIKENNNKEVELFLELADYHGKKLTQKQKILVAYLKQNKRIKKNKVKEILDIGVSVVKKLLDNNIIKIVEIEKEEKMDDNYINSNKLSIYQKEIFNKIKCNLDKNKFNEYLLHGITGSGKTEIYLKLVEEVLKLGREAIILVPEIILTPQIEKKFKKIFGNNVVVIHSRLTAREKFLEWKKIKEGKVKICLGTRSAIFAPFEKLGLIIIDEEHENSYKQSDNPRYEAKDIAKKRAIYNKCSVVYASATPSIDLYYRFEKNNPNNLLTLTQRFNNVLPKVEVLHVHDKEEVISKKLLNKIKEKISKNEQILLLMNKRGYTNYIRCFSCGHMYTCENCDISLNYHKHDNSLRCHFCGFHKKIANIKKCCDNPELVSGNYGIQRVEEYLRENIKDVRITRMDSDTTGKKGAYEKLLTDFREHKSDILLGTQMISKGLDFPNITLVGVLSIDSLIAIPSFKANEKLFQLLVQTAGRAGRSEKAGEVIFQTNVSSSIIDFAIRHNYKDFYNYELKRRKLINYPPFCNISFITIKGYAEEKVSFVAKSIYNFLKEKYGDKNILGPNKSIFYKINNEYKFNIAIRFQEVDYKKLYPLLKYINNYFEESYATQKITITIDNSALDYM